MEELTSDSTPGPLGFWVRTLALGGAACLTGALWVAVLTPETSGYDLTIIGAYPAALWALTIGASVLTCLSLLLAGSDERMPGWASLAVFGVMAVNVFVVSLPLVRGYLVSDRADPMTHIGFAQDIVRTGKLDAQDFYPALHILQYALQAASGATPGQALDIIVAAFAVVWTLSIAVLAGRLAGRPGAAYIGAAFSAPLALGIFQVYGQPSVLSAMLVPLILAMHLRRNQASGYDRLATTIVEIFLSFLLVYFHPITAAFAIALLLAIGIGGQVYQVLARRVPGQAADDQAVPGLAQVIGAVQILAVVLIAWTTANAVIDRSLATVIHWLLGERDTSSAVSQAAGLVQVSHLPYGQLIWILINAFGLPVAVVALTFIGCVVIVTRAWRTRSLPSPSHFAFIFLYVSALVVTSSLFLISSPERSPIRLLRLLVVLGLGALGWWTYELVRRGPDTSRPARRGPILAVAGTLLAVMIGAGQLNAFPDPRNGSPNGYVSRHELSGMEWLFNSRTPGYGQAAILPNYTSRYQAYRFGYEGQTRLGPRWYIRDIWLPTHFYGKQLTCMHQLDPTLTTYLALSTQGRISWHRFPKSVRHLAHIYDRHDWARLTNDASVDQVYSNGGFQVWVTNGAHCRAQTTVAGGGPAR